MTLGPLEVLKDVTDRFEKIGIEYFLVGSLAAMYYSRPRFTNDIDLVAQIKAVQIKDFEAHFPLQDYYCPPFEIIRDEVLRMGAFNLIHQTTGIKIDIVLQKNTEHSKSEFLRRKKITLLPGLEAYLASPEDIILKKLDYFRTGGSEKHLHDIREILAETSIDNTYLASWVARLHLEESWKLI